MAMTNSDYKLIADAINNALKNESNIIDILADAFFAYDMGFNKEAFVEACLKDYIPKKKEKLDGIIVGAVYEIAACDEGDPEWMEEGTHVVLLGIDKWDYDVPLKVGSLDGAERTTWIHLEQLGNMVRMP